MFNIEQRFIIPCSSLRHSVRYLIHADNPDKYQYLREEIISNWNIDRFFVEKEDEQKKVKKVLDYLESVSYNVSTKELFRWCVNNECYDVLRRSSYLFITILKEERK